MCFLKTSLGPDSPAGKVAFVQPLCRLKTCSDRHRKCGIQPMSPSVSEKRRSGKSPQNCAHTSSSSVYADISDELVIAMLGGASVENSGAREDEPMCVHSTTLFSDAALNSGYQ